jgi:aspartoacylase
MRLSPEARWPVFINEAAYGEKGIALSLCRRERWLCQSSWADALGHLLQRSGPL